MILQAQGGRNFAKKNSRNFYLYAVDYNHCTNS